MSDEWMRKDADSLAAPDPEIQAQHNAALARLRTRREAGPAAEAVWRVCHVLTADCKRCPPGEDMPPHGVCIRGCYLQAEECVNTVETGNPWRKTEGVRPPFVVKAVIE